jgi:hypothetical protein
MGARNENDPAIRPGGRSAERVALTLNHEYRHADGLEFGQARLLRSPGRVEREREADDGSCSGRGGGATRDARTGRAAADDQRQVGEELRDDGEPDLVEPAGWRGASPTGNAVRLLDEGDAELGFVGRRRGSDKVARFEPATGPVPEHERGSWGVDET